MIKSEADLKRGAWMTMLYASIIMAVISLFMKNISILGGYVLGALFSILILELDCFYSRTLIGLQVSKNPSAGIAGMVMYFKMGIYAVGFFIAVKIPGIFCLYTVAIGYLTVKVTIYRLALTRR